MHVFSFASTRSRHSQVTVVTGELVVDKLCYLLIIHIQTTVVGKSSDLLLYIYTFHSS